jgi:diketogulonate reductase-like aldo/keto reductase
LQPAWARKGGACDEIREEDMEHIKITGLPFDASRIGLGTWAIGGWLWGGTEESDAIKTIHTALDNGINLIDTAPVYGFGRSEELVGKALQGGRRADAIIATKVGLDWGSGKILRNSIPARLRQELEDSLRRLKTDVIDIYQVHWPDASVPFEERRQERSSPSPRGKEPHHRRQQFFAGADGPLQEGGAARRHPAALQSVRA